MNSVINDNDVKSGSAKVTPSTPKNAKRGNASAGNTHKSKPLTKAAIIAPLAPPVELPKIAAVPPVMKLAIIPGMIIGKPIKGKTTTQAISVKKLTIKPTNTQFGALSNNTIGSTAGTQPGATTCANPLKAGIISSVKIATPFLAI